MFNFFKRVFAQRKIVSPSPGLNYIPWFRTAGVFVTPETAMTLSAVYRAIAFISNTVAILPWGVYLDQEPKTSDAVHRILRKRPNPEMSAFEFMRLMVSSSLIWGNAYAEIEFTNGNVPKHLWFIHPACVTPRRDNSGVLFYQVSVHNQTQYFNANQIFHIRNIGSDGIVGYSIIGLAARSIGGGIAAEEFESNLYKNHALPSGVLEHPKTLSGEAVVRLRDQFGDRFGGSKNAGKPIVLEEGMKFSPLTFKPEDLQFIESRRFTVEEIARWFGLPPHKLSDTSRSTYNNIEHQSQEVINDAILPWCKALESEADYKLLGSRKEDVYTKLDIRGLLRGDNASRAQYYTSMLQNGVYSVNDVRSLEDMPSVAGGDKHLVQLNMTTIENAGEVPESEKDNGAQNFDETENR
ncbi:MAG: phage portal protein [Desulfovibrio sp.]|jgi:HK97 family phage portal protein|nr:phage portal protein [Desulfovibrio sp.]